MSVISPLSPRQKAVWSLLGKGLTMSEVAEQMQATPQYVHQTRRDAVVKISRALMETAEANHLKVLRMRPEEGILWGHHPGLELDAVVTYITSGGIRVWYWYDDPESVTDEAFLEETKEYLLDLADEKHVELTQEERSMHPGRLANTVFSRLLRGVGK